MLNRIAILLALCAAFLLFAIPVSAAPVAQSTLPDFTLNAKTVISITVAISDGQVIVVPVNLNFVAQNHDGETDVSLISDADQQPGIFIGIAPSRSISATLLLPQAAGSATPVPVGQGVVHGTGTHAANRNANLRGGPGTDYPVVGSLRKGDAVTVIEQNSEHTWDKLADGKWIASFLLDPISNSGGDSNSGDDTAADDGNSDSTGNDENNTDNSEDNNGNGQDEAEPTPTVTPTPLADQAELETYVLALSSIGAGAAGAVDQLTSLVSQPEPLSADWNNNVSAQLGVLSDALDQFLALTPVPGYEDLHTQVTDVALTCEQSLDTIRNGLDNPLSIDPDIAIQATGACAAKARVTFAPLSKRCNKSESLQVLPQVLHTYQNHHLDNLRWQHFTPRVGDIVISTSLKSGTTLTQEIVRHLIFFDQDPSRWKATPLWTMSPWLDRRTSPLDEIIGVLEAQTHRRFIKSHLALDGLPYFPELKYIVVARDARDVFMSCWNHYGGLTAISMDKYNLTPGRVGPPIPPCPTDIHEFWQAWITRGWFEWECEGYPFWGNMHHSQSWWNFHHLDNIHLVHYNDLLSNLPGEIRHIADYLDIAVSDEIISSFLPDLSLEAMRKNGEGINPVINQSFRFGADTFFFKGSNGRWKQVLSPEEVAQYEDTAGRVLDPDCRAWLETGRTALP